MSNEEQGITLNVSVQDVNTILAGLGEVPAKISMSIINSIREQAEAQLQPPLESIEKQ